MSRVKKGGMTGADLSPKNKGKKGGLTDSKHFEPLSVEDVINKIDNRESQVKSTQNTDSTSSRNNGRKAPNRENNTLQHNPSELTTSDHKNTFQVAKKLGSEYGVELTDITHHMSASNDNVDASLGEGISNKEANTRKLAIARQNNLLEVRNERIKQKRKIATNYVEELGLLGDIVDIETKTVNLANKVVKYQTEVTDYRTAQSVLEQHEELYLQQAIRTQGTRDLTAGIKEEMELKFLQQESKNDALFLAIENTDKHNDQLRLNMDAILLAD